ncbi:hypothetical protein ACN28S_05575 [Cystobacter fuscus]
MPLSPPASRGTRPSLAVHRMESLACEASAPRPPPDPPPKRPGCLVEFGIKRADSGAGRLQDARTQGAIPMTDAVRRFVCVLGLVLGAAGCGPTTGENPSSGGCGDGVVQQQETCDDGQHAGGDGCDGACRWSRDGNARVRRAAVPGRRVHVPTAR